MTRSRQGGRRTQQESYNIMKSGFVRFASSRSHNNPSLKTSCMKFSRDYAVNRKITYRDVRKAV